MLHLGPLTLQRAIAIATQVADGLAKAHEAGVVHRDLKPENLMISRDGFVKILDFGLAKLAAFDELSNAETLNVSLTQVGTILGTIEYMSPEQANGLPVDFRSDQFSFGSVLYEMVTGKPAFRRHSKAETLAAILPGQSRAHEFPELTGSCAALLGDRTLPCQESWRALYLDP